MDNGDRRRFFGVLSACLDYYGKERNDAVLGIWWRLLEGYPVEVVEAALAEHMRNSKFAPTAAEVIAVISSKDGRPTADEAWAMCPRSEYESVVWTDEMAQAYGVAAPLLEHGDQVAARKAFIDRYEGLVAKARAAGTPVKVTPSFGWDAAGREAAVAKAVERGLLPASRAQAWLGVDSAVPAIQMPELKRLQ